MQKCLHIWNGMGKGFLKMYILSFFWHFLKHFYYITGFCRKKFHFLQICKFFLSYLDIKHWFSSTPAGRAGIRLKLRPHCPFFGYTCICTAMFTLFQHNIWIRVYIIISRTKPKFCVLNCYLNYCWTLSSFLAILENQLILRAFSLKYLFYFQGG